MGILKLWSEKYSDKAVNTVNVKDIIRTAIRDNSSISIVYEKSDGSASERIVSDLSSNTDYNKEGLDYFKGMCQLRNEERVFKIDRIRNIKIIH